VNVENLVDQAAYLLQSGKSEKAVQVLRKALQAAPHHPDANHLHGLAMFDRREFRQAIASIRKAIELNASNPTYWNNLGLVYLASGSVKDALQAHEKAQQLDSSNPLVYLYKGNVYRQIGHADNAIAAYEKALELDPYSVQCLSNMASVLLVRMDLDRAVSLLENALAIEPKFAMAWNNLGLVKQRMGKIEDALQAFRQAINIMPKMVEAHVNLGNLLMSLNRFSEASEVFQLVLKLDPGQPLVLGNLAYCRSMMCDWQQYRSLWQKIHEQVRRGAIPCSPIVFLNGSDDIAAAAKLASSYTGLMVPGLAQVTDSPVVAKRKQKLRIGYFSTDFREHPVATLIVGVIEQHDRERFEVFGYALNPEDGSSMRQRMKKAFDRFIDISELSDDQVVEQVRADELDIVIDLNGYTEGCRPVLFKTRLAPVQVCYLGFPGTSGADFFDYTIADERIIPDSARRYYTEHILYLPDSFQPNDDTRALSQEPLSRAQFGLPEDKIVFCCFNKLYKLNPEVFESWMSILKQVPESVLWLYTEDEIARVNLRKAASKAGVQQQRLVFAGRTEKYDHHLARYRLADLFLDTFPYTAHTTASDAMWAGLPVLTRSGQSLASRVGESLLHTLGLDELVTHSIPEFVSKAVAIAQEGSATDRKGFDRLKRLLSEARETSSLYNTRQYARWLENGLWMIHERACEGLPAQTMHVPRK